LNRPLPTSSGIELRHLRYFLAVYEELHFSRAAERLHIAQPPLSQAIRKLEAELGATLLERTSRNVTPTEAGHVFAAEARKVLASLTFAVGEVQRAARPDPKIQVGCGIHIPARQLHRFLNALKQREPGVQAEVTHLLGLEQVARLRSGKLDLGVFSLAEAYEGIEWERLLPGDALSAFLPATHPLASNQVLTPDDIQHETLLMSARSVNPALWDSLRAAIANAGFRFARIHECSTDPRDVLLAVVGGLGFALGPDAFKEIGRFVSPELVAVPLDPPVTYPETVVAWRSDPPRLIAQLEPSVREAAAELFARADESLRGSHLDPRTRDART
jgi:DNA-binding transcriptional LysR family regulator